VTPAGKWLTLGLSFTVLLGGGGGGAYYYHKRELRRAVETQEAALKTLREQAAKDLWRSRARSLLLEAALATRYGNYAMAFERLIRTQGMAARLGAQLDAEFMEMQQFLLQQRPDAEVAARLAALADKIEPPAPLGPTDPSQKPGTAQTTSSQIGITAAKSTATQPGPQQPAAAGPPAVAAPAAAPHTAAPSPAAAPAAAASPAGATPGAPLALPKRGQSPEASLEEGRQAIGQAKVLLLSGREAPVVIEWLARAQVVLDDSGKGDLGEQVTVAIKAVRSGDEAKAQKTIDGLLAKLRGQ
jgi:hypothetical protein